MGIIKRDRWTESEVLLLPLDEHDYLERKAGALLTDKDFDKDMAKAISALANSSGGYLILGQQNDGIFDGLPGKQGRTPTREWLEQKLPFLVSYPLKDFRIHEVKPDTPTSIPANKIVVVIEISDSNLAPHQSVKDNLYYHRVGGHSKPAPHFYLEMLRGRSRFPSPEVVWVWFDTVINPLLSNLAIQHRELDQRVWMFEKRTGNIKGISSVAERQSPFAITGNSEQFFETYPHIKESLNKREEAYNIFQQRVTEFYKTIRESTTIFECFKFCISPESLQTVRNNIKDTYVQSLSDADLLQKISYGTEEQFLDSLAEYTVNKIPQLNDNYTTAPFWNVHGERFLSLLKSTEAGYCERRVNEASELLLSEGLSVSNLLEDTRKQLSQQYGVPYYRAIKQIESSSSYF